MTTNTYEPKAVKDMNRKELIEFLQFHKAYAGHSRDGVEELRDIATDVEAAAADLTTYPAPEVLDSIAEAYEAQVASTRGTGGTLPEGATSGTCRACSQLLPIKRFPKAIIDGARQANVRSDECRACRDARRAARSAA